MTTPLYWIELNNTDELWVGTTFASLLAGLIRGFLKLDPDDRTAARRAHATTVARTVQDRLLSNAITDGAVD